MGEGGGDCDLKTAQCTSHSDIMILCIVFIKAEAVFFICIFVFHIDWYCVQCVCIGRVLKLPETPLGRCRFSGEIGSSYQARRGSIHML